MSDIDISAISKVDSGLIDYPPGRTLGPRTQADLQFVMLDRGSVVVDVEGTETRLAPGQLVCQWPGFRETYRFDPQVPSSHRWISLTPDGDRGKQCLLSIRETLPRLGVETTNMRSVFNMIHNEPALSAPDAGEITPDPIWPQVKTVLAVAYLTAFAGQSTAGSRHTDIALLPRPLQKLERFIGKRYESPLALADLAEAAAVSPSYLIRLCRKHGQPTPMQWLWKIRVNRAHDLLKYSGLTVAEIAYRVGFSSPYHFSRLFKEGTGMVPTEARKVAWNASDDANPIERG